MEINLLNKLIDKDVNKYHEKTKFEFYKLFLSLVNKEYWSAMEINLLAMMMCFPDKKLQKKHTTKIANLLKISSAQVINYKNKLESKYYIKDAELIDYFKTVVKKFNNEKQIKITLPITLK